MTIYIYTIKLPSPAHIFYFYFVHLIVNNIKFTSCNNIVHKSISKLARYYTDKIDIRFTSLNYF